MIRCPKNYMLQITNLLEVVGINFRESKKRQKFPRHDLDVIRNCV